MKNSGVDVAIIGGGVIGCGLAWRLSSRGLRVAIIEREAPAAEASSAAAGILAAQVEAHGPGPLLDLALKSRELYPRWRDALFEETGHEISYRPCGALMLAGVDSDADDATTAAELAELETRRAWQTARGLRVEMLDRAALRDREPSLASCAGALYSPDDGQVDPVRLCQALVQAATRHGARVLHATAERIEIQGARVRGVAMSRGDSSAPQYLASDKVVLCAGSWSTHIPGSPLPPRAVEPVRGQMVELLAEPGLLQHVIFAHVAPGRGGNGQPLGGYLVPRRDGKILVGSTMERVGFVKQVTPHGLLSLLSLASVVSPPLGSAAVVRTWSGLRPGTIDELPILGPTAIDGLHICTGHFRNGILLAPVSAELMCSLLSDSDPPPRRAEPPLNIDLEPFSPARLDNRLT